MSKVWRLVVVACFVVGTCSVLSDSCHALKLDREALGLGTPDQNDEDQASLGRRIAMSSPVEHRLIGDGNPTEPQMSRSPEPQMSRSPIDVLKFTLRLLLHGRLAP